MSTEVPMIVSVGSTSEPGDVVGAAQTDKTVVDLAGETAAITWVKPVPPLLNTTWPLASVSRAALTKMPPAPAAKPFAYPVRPADD
jgi:hypothetical protein